MPNVMEQEELYLATFRELDATRSQREPAWLHPLRQEAIQRFAELGFPTTHQEEWKYTSVAPLTRISFQLAGPEIPAVRREELEELFFGHLPENRLVFVNGHYCASLSGVEGLPAAVRAGALAGMLSGGDGMLDGHLARYADFRTHPFVALNTAFWQDGAFLRVPKGVAVDTPIHFVYLSAADGVPRMSHPRALVVVERGAQATLVESYWGYSEGVCCSNAVTEIAVGEDAVVDHYKFQAENKETFHLGTLQVSQDRNSSFSSCSISLGGSLARNELTAVLEAEGAECTLQGLYAAAGQQLVDHHTTIDHAQPHGTSRQLYNGILDGSSSGVFNGRILVRPNAQKTNAFQKNRNLLLSEDATIDTKPQLEIAADDVRCTHGATIGQIDPEALFYLRSRGISRREARELLIHAFAAEVLDQMQSASVRALVERALRAHLSSRASGEEAP